MNIKARVKKLERVVAPTRPEIFTYRQIVRPALKGEDGPQVTAVNFPAGKERVTLDRTEGETVGEPRARMDAVVKERTGAPYAIGVDEGVKET